MSKVYLLLRNNKQSGPHSLEELLKLGLKPMDLIWVEGKSFGWSYPSEIQSLKSYVASVPGPSLQSASENNNSGNNHQKEAPASNDVYMPAAKPSPVSESSSSRKIYVSMPAGSRPATQISTAPVNEVQSSADAAEKLEQKAEALRKKMQSYSLENKTASKVEEPLVTKYSATLQDREEEYTSWIYNKKSRKTNDDIKKWIPIGAAGILIIALVFGFTRYSGNNQEEIINAVTVTPEPQTSQTPDQPLITENEIVSNPSNLEKELVSKNAEAPNEVAEAPKKNVESPKATVKKPTAPAATPFSQKSAVPFATNKTALTPQKNQPKETYVKTPALVKSEPSTPVKKQTEIVEAVPQKKKTLNQKVDAFFNKLSRKIEEPAPAAGQPQASSTTTTTVPGTKERKAIYRDDKPGEDKSTSTVPYVAEPVSANLAEFVEVKTNKPAENWMLGVHGLKITVSNTGKETVKTAEVEMRYYTEQNEVLEKKIVNFSNIAPGKTVTLPAPNHRLADHADFRLVTAK